MLLELPLELIRLISFALPLSDLAHLIRCHSRLRFLSNELSWELRFRHDNTGTVYAKASKILVSTWREFYHLSLQRVLVVHRSGDKIKKTLFGPEIIRPLYITSHVIVDVLGRNFRVGVTIIPEIVALIELKWNDHIKILSRQIAMTNGEAFRLILNQNNDLVLLILRGARKGTRIILYPGVLHFSYTVYHDDRILLAVMNEDNKVRYYCGYIERLLNGYCVDDWNPIIMSSQERVLSVAVYHSWKLIIEVITTREEKRELHTIKVRPYKTKILSRVKCNTSLIRNISYKDQIYSLDKKNVLWKGDYDAREKLCDNISLIEVGPLTQVRNGQGLITSLDNLLYESRKEFFLVPYGVSVGDDVMAGQYIRTR